MKKMKGEKWPVVWKENENLQLENNECTFGRDGKCPHCPSQLRSAQHVCILPALLEYTDKYNYSALLQYMDKYQYSAQLEYTDKYKYLALLEYTNKYKYSAILECNVYTQINTNNHIYIFIQFQILSSIREPVKNVLADFVR